MEYFINLKKRKPTDLSIPFGRGLAGIVKKILTFNADACKVLLYFLLWYLKLNLRNNRELSRIDETAFKKLEKSAA